MDKLVTKQDFIKNIRQHLNTLGLSRGERINLNKTVSTRKVICNGEHNIEERVIWASRSRVCVEWYWNGVKQDYSGDYPWNNPNANYGICMNTCHILRDMAEKVA